MEWWLNHVGQMAQSVQDYSPYLFVVLEDGYSVDDIREKVTECLEPYMYPVDIIELEERPFFHFKTNRIGLTNDILNGKFE